MRGLERPIGPVHEDVAGQRLVAEGALVEEVVDLHDVRLVDVEHGRRPHGTAALHAALPCPRRGRRSEAAQTFAAPDVKGLGGTPSLCDHGLHK
jgi:hypothetical protein